VFGCLKIPRTRAASEEKRIDREGRSLSDHKIVAHDTRTQQREGQQQGGRAAGSKPQRTTRANEPRAGENLERKIVRTGDRSSDTQQVTKKDKE
jgi:hypothetical protein